ncbi:MAG: hypothetical protein ABI599_04120 [Flavobacteriales bacterium]
MRTHFLLPALLAATISNAQVPTDSTGLPGDHFSLEGALDLFKRAANIEAFEKALNAEDNHVNNLDLNGDGNVDYVRVETRKEGSAVAIVMQVAVSKEEAQDVAVIELEKTGDASAVVQIRGDETLYGADAIVEPYAEGDAKGGKAGPAAPEDFGMWVTVDVWMWPCVQWCYGPSFVVWYSPWYWDFYPQWWHPWHHAYWHAWHHHHGHFDGWYHHVDVCRTVSAHGLYGHHRMSSPTVARNTAARRQQITNAAPRKEAPGSKERVAPTQDPGKTAPSREPSKTSPERRRDRARQAPTPKPTPAPGKQRRRR